MNNTSEVVSTFSELDPFKFEGLINDECFGILGDNKSVIEQGVKGQIRWFETKEGLIKFLHEDFIPLVMSGKEVTNTFQEQYLRIINHLLEGDMNDAIVPLNQLLEGAWHLQWIGSFRELCLSADHKSKEIRKIFSGLENGDSESTPIVNSVMKEAFRDFVKQHSF